MPNHFTNIGFPIHDEASFQRYAELAAEYGARVDTPGGGYIRWRAGEGAELWLQLDRRDRAVGLVPHFAGRVRRRGAVTRVVRRPNESPLDGAMHGWANPRSDDPESGDYPLLFDLPDFDRVGALALPATVEVQLAAFAHSITVHESDEAFAAAQPSQSGMAAESFIPSGLFTPDDDPAAVQYSEAVFAGHVREAALRTNPVTGLRFWWARIQTYGGELDVVADPELVPPRGIPAGGVAYGGFWLTGRLPDVTPVERPQRARWRWVSRT